MPRLHPRNYALAAKSGGRIAELQLAILTVDLHNVQRLTARAPELTQRPHSGNLLEEATQVDLDFLGENYNHAPFGDHAPTTLTHGYNYLSRKPSYREFQTESLHVIDRLVQKGVNPLREYEPEDSFMPGQLSHAANRMFEADISETNFPQKARVVLHALHQRPDFRPDIPNMFANMMDMDDMEEQYSRHALAQHVMRLGQAVGSAIQYPSNKLEREVARNMSRADKRFWCYPDNGWVHDPDEMPRPSYASRGAYEAHHAAITESSMRVFSPYELQTPEQEQAYQQLMGKLAGQKSGLNKGPN